MIQITISGNTPAELAASALSIAALFGGTADTVASPLSASDQARLRGDAVVVPPKDDKAAAKAAAKAAKKAEEEAAAALAAEEAAKANEKPEDDDDALGEKTATETLTTEDVKKLLIEVRTAYPKDATIVSKIVKEHGKEPKLSDVKAEQLPAVAAECRRLLAAAKK